MASDGEQKRLEDAAGPHGARTTELVGVDDIGLPSGIQPEDVKDMPQAATVAAMGGDSGTVGSGDDVCPVCAGSGKNASGGACPNCRGTGIITEGIGGG